MKNVKNDDLERWIKEAIHAEVEDSPSPLKSSDEAWEQIVNEFNRRKMRTRKRWSFKTKWMYVASMFAVAVSIMFFSNQSSLAYGSFAEFFQKVQGSVMHLFVKVEKEPIEMNAQKEIPNNEPHSSGNFSMMNDSEMVTKQLGLEEAQKETEFTLVIPDYIPSDFHLNNVTVIKQAEELSSEIYLNYESQDGTFYINQGLIDDSFAMGAVLDKEDANVEQVLVNGQQASFLLYKDGSTDLIWISQDEKFCFIISGMLSKKEIIKIAESM
ncbi:DUF4367 domain-containing protein [Bacillus niameyensis]|uniref:DUF4367 domain-containing protein n=1 Tax=Bacillus niameyensis TaxID=1522308 RepID=UPI0007829A8B|nr:DUF4367 domain-containing protein [Bacillus niameyensis]